MKNIIILDGDYSTDIRVRKEMRLVDHCSRDIQIICTELSQNIEKSRVKDENIAQINVNKMLYLLSKIIERSFFINPLILYWLKKNPHLKEVKTIQVHDLPLAKTLIWLRNKNIISKNKTKLILDLHEVWPHALQDWHSHKTGLLGFIHRIIHSVSRWEKYEKEAVQYFDHIIVVTEEMKQRLKKLHKVKDEKISVIENFEFYDKNLANKICSLSSPKHKKLTHFGYIGGIALHRGLSDLIEAFILDKSIRTSCCLKIFGNGDEEYIDFLKHQIKKYQLENNIHIFGYVPLKDIFSNKNYQFDVGCIPHLKSEHTDHTIPHKLFQYTQRGLPILSSNCNPLVRYLENYPLKTIFTSHDIVELCKKIHQIAEQRRTFKVNSETTKAIDLYNRDLCFSKHQNKLIEIISN